MPHAMCSALFFRAHLPQPSKTAWLWCKQSARRPVLLVLAFILGFQPSAIGQPIYLVKDINLVSGSPFLGGWQSPARLGNRIIFSAYSSVGGEPWISDGTEAGTHLLKDTYPNNSYTQFQSNFAQLGNELVYSGPTALGSEPWITDGTTVGTRLLFDINPGPDSSLPTRGLNFNGRLYFVANDGVHGAEF